MGAQVLAKAQKAKKGSGCSYNSNFGKEKHKLAVSISPIPTDLYKFD
jgi:hypothetical protein